MRRRPPAIAEAGRVRQGKMATSAQDRNEGVFHLKFLDKGQRREVKLRCLVSDGMGWEHVSVSVVGENRCPTWNEMCYVKDIFWPFEEAVMQLHPPKSQAVNMHPYVLHLWRPVGGGIPGPPGILVGLKDKSLTDALRKAAGLPTLAEEAAEQPQRKLPTLTVD